MKTSPEYFSQGEELQDEGDYAGATKEFRNALWAASEDADENLQIYQRLTEVYIIRGLKSKAEKANASAEEKYRLAYQNGPASLDLRRLKERIREIREIDSWPSVPISIKPQTEATLDINLSL